MSDAHPNTPPDPADLDSLRLNSAGRTARTFVDSKLTPLFVLFVLLLGVLAALTTPREENPQIVVPGAQVTFGLPGASPTEVERLIVAPMEGVLRQIDGVDHTFAVASYGVGQVQVQFDVGVDEDAAMSRITQRVAANRHLLPANATPPLVRQLDIDDVPIVTHLRVQQLR